MILKDFNLKFLTNFLKDIKFTLYFLKKSDEDIFKITIFLFLVIILSYLF